jgi:Domain of unknown function (DUF5916)/Carbohydrate family 9 binding domain-like
MARWVGFLPLYVCAALVAWIGSSGTVRAQEESAPLVRPAGSNSVDVARVTSAITLDGVLDEPAWQNAATIGDLVQHEPHAGQPPSEKTEVRLLHDGDYLYVGVICHDSEPAGIIGTQMARDAPLGDDDRIEIVLDTFRDRRNAFYFATNPAGALVDGLVIENGGLNLHWDAIWEVRSRRSATGWSAEFAIPFKSLRFRDGQSGWGFNFSRTIKRKIEEDRWTGARLDLAFLQVSEAGEVTGLDDVSQGVGLDVRPFVAVHRLESAATGDSTTTGDPGLDVFYAITSNLNLSATVNTDFGATEVDARQINLTRFPLFFPEKRSFFLENAGNFSFSNTGADFRNAAGTIVPFFSRRIGLLAGEEVPIKVGAQLTGKIGRTDVGLLDVRTGDSAVAPAQDFFVGRVKQNLLRQSYVGAIYTQGDPEGLVDSSTFGADFRFATSQFLGLDRNFAVDVFGLTSQNEGVSGDDSAYGFSVEYPNDLVDFAGRLARSSGQFPPGARFRAEAQRAHAVDQRGLCAAAAGFPQRAADVS